MTPAERQALREKHVAWDYYAKFHPGEVPQCHGCNGFTDWPCDTIRVLDAYEELVARTEQPPIQP